MRRLLGFSKVIDKFTEYIGKLMMIFILLAIFISSGNAIVRKAFALSSNALLEIQWYLFATAFLLGAGYTFLRNAHVRIDFLSSMFSARTRNVIDVVCMVLIVVPLCLVLIKFSMPLVINAYVGGEMSSDSGGLIRWPIYMMLPLGMVLLLVQNVSEIIKRIAFLKGYIPDPLVDGYDEEEEISILAAK